MPETTRLRRLAGLMSRLMLVVPAAACFGSSFADAGALYLYTWSDYVPPALIQRFEREMGIEVTLDEYDSNKAMLAALRDRPNGYDIAVPSGYVIGAMITEGLAERIHAAALPNFRNVRRPHDSPPFDPGREYSAPYVWGTTGFAYDTARAPDLEDTWREFFEPRGELRGLVVALGDPLDIWNAAAYYLDIDKCTESPGEVERIVDVLDRQKPKLAMYSSSGVIERMAAGEVVMHQIWNGAAHRAALVRPTIRYVYPREGLDVWGDHLVVPRGARNIANARTFIDWMMKPENAAEATNFTRYMNAIEGSEVFLDPDLLSDPAVNMPDEYAQRLRPFNGCSEAARKLRDGAWSRLEQ